MVGDRQGDDRVGGRVPAGRVLCCSDPLLRGVAAGRLHDRYRGGNADPAGVGEPLGDPGDLERQRQALRIGGEPWAGKEEARPPDQRAAVGVGPAPQVAKTGDKIGQVQFRHRVERQIYPRRTRRSQHGETQHRLKGRHGA